LQIADLDGLAHYKALGINKSANAEAIKKANQAPCTWIETHI
jgi:hypothetical protein